MKTLKQLGLVFVLVILGWACDNDDDGHSGCDLPAPYGINSLENAYDCENTENDMDINLNDTHVLIRTQAEFDNLVTGTCMPQIDFDMYDLLIGKQALTNGLDQIIYAATACDGTVYLEVRFRLNATDIAPNVTYHSLLEKIPNDFNLEVLIDIQ